MLSLLLCRCEDYILIENDFVSTEICGNSTSTPTWMLLLSNNFRVFFRTSESVQGHGFEMYSICFSSDEPGIIHTCICQVLNTIFEPVLLTQVDFQYVMHGTNVQ